MNFKTKVVRQFRRFSMLAAASTFLTISAGAQCLVSSLDVSTGIDNGTILSGQQDPHWDITYIQAPVTGYNSIVMTPTDAYVTNTPTFWGKMAINSSTTNFTPWLSMSQYHASTGDKIEKDQEILYQRPFSICEEGDYSFDFLILTDNYIPAIEIVSTSGSTSYTFPQSQNYTNSNTNAITTWTVNQAYLLSAGDYYLRVHVINAANMQNGSWMTNPTGLSLQGTITSSTGAIVDDQNPACQGYVCGSSSGCSDLCYWKVEGNTIYNNKNIFGTLNEYGVNIQTEAHDRGVLTPGGDNTIDPTAGRFGWNTMNPTARLHVDCINGNENGSGTSDIRFENLESGEGYVLVIDDQGYVYNTYINIADLGGPSPIMEELAEEKKKNDELQKRVDALTARVGMLEQSNTTGVNTVSGQNNTLYQNTPNPFDKSTTIKYSIKSMNSSAYIIVYDLNGRELNKTAVEGDGNITIDGNTLVPGMYLYSLVVDGVAVDTKRMVLSK